MVLILGVEIQAKQMGSGRISSLRFQLGVLQEPPAPECKSCMKWAHLAAAGRRPEREKSDVNLQPGPVVCRLGRHQNVLTFEHVAFGCVARADGPEQGLDHHPEPFLFGSSRLHPIRDARVASTSTTLSFTSQTEEFCAETRQGITRV